jgi:predicted DNA-binding ribbon-helix-helix protein
MIDVTVNSQLITSTTESVKEQSLNNDNAVNMLLAKLDEGTQTVMNLRSILTLKTAELNELLAQLELTNQAITTVESTTAQIEAMLKDLGLSDSAKESLLINAGACLDSAIKSASVIYNNNNNSNNNSNAKGTIVRRPSTTSTNSNGVDTVSSTEKRFVRHKRGRRGRRKRKFNNLNNY